MSRRLPVVVITFVMIAVLATTGLAYGLWSETLVIDGTVTTGEVDVGFKKAWAFDWVQVNGLHQNIPFEKDINTCEVELWDFDPNSDGLEGLTVTVKNAYPSYHCFIAYTIKSYGNVPVHVNWAYGDAPDWVQISSCYPNWVQLHQNDKAYGRILIHFTNDDGVLENEEYKFSFKIDALQWNEAPATGTAPEACITPPDFITIPADE